MASEAKSVDAVSVVSRNPATGEVLAELTSVTSEGVRNAVLRAKEAQPRWQATPINARIALLRRFQQFLTERRDDVARLL